MPHLDDTPLEQAVGIGLDGKARRVVFLDAADVALADIGVDFHLGEIAGDQEQCRCLETRRDRLPNRHVARDHGAVHRRNDVGVAEVYLCGREFGLALLDCRLVDHDLRLRLVVDALRLVGDVEGNRFLLRQQRHASGIDLCVLEVCLVFFELRLGDRQDRLVLVDHRLIGTGIDLGADLPFRDPGIVVARELLDDAGHVTADDDRQHRVDRPGRGDGAGDRTARHRRRRIVHRGGAAGVPPHRTARGHQQDDDDTGEPIAPRPRRTRRGRFQRGRCLAQVNLHPTDSHPIIHRRSPQNLANIGAKKAPAN